MSRGLGSLQRNVKEIIARALAELEPPQPLRFTDIRAVYVLQCGGKPYGDKLPPSFERSLKRALKSLVDRGDVLILRGQGRPGDPYRYVTVEYFAGVANRGKKVDTKQAKQIVAELSEALQKAGPPI